MELIDQHKTTNQEGSFQDYEDKTDESHTSTNNNDLVCSLLLSSQDHAVSDDNEYRSSYSYNQETEEADHHEEKLGICQGIYRVKILS
mmetsp:Transcript_38977/g.38593  ORF Transcript_38977/g.38593 Transcript_38977/m.38593 type:complete len:88 (-) Transcript_38977:57-320(-)